jgi:hypothetical protein
MRETFAALHESESGPKADILAGAADVREKADILLEPGNVCKCDVCFWSQTGRRVGSVSKVALDYGCSLHQLGHLTL